MPRFFLALLILFLSLIHSSICQAQGFIEHLAPPVLERGKTTRLTVVGSHLTNVLDLWTSLPSGKIKATPISDSNAEGAVFDVRVADDAPVGMFGLRVATADGLSNVHLCLIDDLPVRAAPDTMKGVAKEELPCALWGRFREGTVDRFAIEVKAGQRVSFEAVGNRLGKEVDPLITIHDSRGRIVAERDNDPGLYFDCRFEHRFADAGTYTVEMRDSRFHGHEHGFYVLRMGRFPAARVAVPAVIRPGKKTELFLPELNETLEFECRAGHHAGPFSLALRRKDDEGSTWLPVEVGDFETTVAAAEALSPEKGTPAKIPGQLCGVLTKPGERQFFRLELTKGQTIQVIAHGRALNSPIDPELSLTDATGKMLRTATGGPDEVVKLDFTAPAAAVYCLGVRDLARDGGPAYAYRLEVRTGVPQLEILAEVEGLTVPRECYQPVPLTVTRGNYGGPITLTLDGAPKGVTLTPTEIPAGVNAVVCKLSATSATPLGLHTVQILAQPTDVPSPPKTLVRTRPMVDRQLMNVDLIPYSLREDQRRLPPSVADRLALQVTEAAPFTVELAEPTVALARYQHAAIPLITTRKPGFDAPITFTARGGQLADKDEGRTRVYAEFPQATAKELKVNGGVHSRILSNIGKTRIEVLASAVHEGRTITLIRTFELEIRTAFIILAPPAPLKVAPGETSKVRLTVDRVKTFAGPVTVAIQSAAGLELPEKVVIPHGDTSAEIEVRVTKEAMPGRRSVQLSGTADVDGFEEEHRGARIEIEVTKPETPKK
jgi:hypothetical protein